MSLVPSTLTFADLVRLGLFGLRTRPGRVALSALGIAIGIAAMIAVVGISTSSQAKLQGVLDGLGTNLLEIEPGKAPAGGRIALPEEAIDLLARLDDVEATAGAARLPDTNAYRNSAVPVQQTKGLTTQVALGDLPEVVGSRLAAGRWFTEATRGQQGVVLGAAAADALGASAWRPDDRIWLQGRWWSVLGVLEPFTLASDLDTSVFVDEEAAASRLAYDGHPTRVFTRVAPTVVEQARTWLGTAANPANPDGVAISRPSDALVAQQASEASFTGLLLGLGGVALLVGGIGVANTMVITVLERRSEIGVRRALGARRRHIRDQFLAESLLLAALGGTAGVLIGAFVTVVFALIQGWPPTIPGWAVAGGLGATVVIGGAAGVYPSSRAARIPPTSALAAT